MPPVASRLCSWAACGRQLTEVENRCGRCKREYYCGRSCQKQHWRMGGHSLVCAEAPCCTICLDGGGDTRPIQCGCACRGAAGLAHVGCKARVAAHVSAGWNDAWAECLTCGQFYTGGMQLGLARELVRQMERRAPADDHRLTALCNLGQALKEAGEHDEAEVLLRDVLVLRRRAFGAKHPCTLNVGTILAETMRLCGRFAEAVALYQQILAATPASFKEHENTLGAQRSCADALSKLGNHAEAEVLLRGILATEDVKYGPGDARTLQTRQTLGDVLREQGKHAEAGCVFRPTMAAMQRVLGPEHPETLRTMHLLARCLGNQGHHAAAELLLQSVLEGRRRACGPEHPDTLATAGLLADTQDALVRHAEAEIRATGKCSPNKAPMWAGALGAEMQI